MANNYSKMHRTNRKIKVYLVNNGYKNIHFFPHSRFSKDVVLDGIGFDGVSTYKETIIFFQCKSNKKASKKLLVKYRELGKKYGIICLHISYFDRVGVIICR